MADYNKLRDICEDFVNNIDGWCELDDGDMIDKFLAEMKAALLSVESTEKSDNTHIKQFPKSTEIWNHVTSFLSWNPGYNIEHARKISALVSKYISRKQLNA